MEKTFLILAILFVIGDLFFIVWTVYRDVVMYAHKKQVNDFINHYTTNFRELNHSVVENNKSVMRKLEEFNTASAENNKAILEFMERYKE